MTQKVNNKTGNILINPTREILMQNCVLPPDEIVGMDHSGLDELLEQEGIFCKPEFNLS